MIRPEKPGCNIIGDNDINCIMRVRNKKETNPNDCIQHH